VLFGKIASVGPIGFLEKYIYIVALEPLEEMAIPGNRHYASRIGNTFVPYRTNDFQTPGGTTRIIHEMK